MPMSFTFCDRRLLLACAALLLGTSASLAQTVSSAPPRTASMLSIPCTDTPPTLDGHIAADEWRQAARTGGFSDLTGFRSDRETTVLAMWDEHHLYLAFESPKRFIQQLPQEPRDGKGLFANDAIEVNLMPRAGGAWYKLAFNPAGSQWDARYADGQPDVAWNADWRVGNRLEHDDYYVTDTWQAEVAVPWKDLGEAALVPGAVWQVQFCRDFDDMEKLDYPVSRRWSSWSPADDGGFNEPETFGQFRFVKDEAVLRFDGYTALTEGQMGLKGNLTRTPDTGASVRLTVGRADGDRAILARADKPLTQAGPFEIAHPMAVESVTEAWMEWEVAAGAPVAAGRARVTIAPAFAVRCVPVPTLGRIWIEGDMSRMPHRPAASRVIARLRNADAGGK